MEDKILREKNIVDLQKKLSVSDKNDPERDKKEE